MKKQIDPGDTYVIREVFACGEGHFLPPGSAYWESGEVCPYEHSPGASNEDVHLYYRLLAIPTMRSERNGGGEMWPFLLSDPDTWGQSPLAPPGAKAGDRIGTLVRA